VKSHFQASEYLIPKQTELADLLKIDSCVPDYSMISTSLLDPLREFLSFEGKKFRAEILDLAFLICGGTPSEESREQLAICSHIIEGLHVGSMIIDDIQDQSDFRRGRIALHRAHGVGVALNAGNWLYFQAIDQLRKLDLEPHQEVYLQRSLNAILLKAHFGQAIDVGVFMGSVPQEKIESTCFTVMELKTGALMSLAFELGAFIATRDTKLCLVLSKFGKNFGVALQMFDDIGNFLSPPPKGKEDLKNGRPSFIWMMASRLAKKEDYNRFLYAARMLPDESFLNSWAGLFNLIPESKKAASSYLWNLKKNIIDDLSESTLDVPRFEFKGSHLDLELRLDGIFKKLEKAYV
jgi:geranylgeranyl pyrophosphate synthase